MDNSASRYIYCVIKYSQIANRILQIEVVDIVNSVRQQYPIIVITVDNALITSYCEIAIDVAKARTETLLLHVNYATSFFKGDL